jgi:acetyl-CoA C-acetyltransferase
MSFAKQSLRRVAIVSACRTAIGGFGGSLKSVKAPHLAAAVMREAVRRAGPGFDVNALGDVRFGNCVEDNDALNTTRVAMLLAGLPVTIPAVTVNRVCTSGMEATVVAMHQIQAGFIDAALTGGVESMSNAPYLLPAARWGARLQDSAMVDSIIHALHCGSHYLPYPKDGAAEWARGKPYIMGATAEFLVQKYGFTRQQQDEVALRSNNAAERAATNGRFADEIVAVSVEQGRGKPALAFARDEHYRPNLKLDDLAKLPPVFIPKTGTVTAGNSSGLNDGASATIVMAEDRAKALGLKPLAYIVGAGIGACVPELMGISPVPAVNDLLRRRGHASCKAFDRVEVNEAFASQYLAVEHELKLNRDVTNVNGSGIGLGHPVGMTGNRLIVTLVHELRKNDLERGMATLCGGGGVSLAVEIENAR